MKEVQIFRATDCKNLPELPEYCTALEEFCPFIAPAQENKILYFSEYSLLGDDITFLQKQMFNIGLLHTEILRSGRAGQTTTQAKALFCENVLFHISDSVQIEGSNLFSWPHWFLKLLYTEVGVLFGKFWKGEQAKSRDGKDIPAPPYHLLSIRSAIKPIDGRFFTKAPELTLEYSLSSDEGKSIIEKIADDSTRNIIGRIEKLDFQTVDRSEFESIIKEMNETTLYESVRNWSQLKESSLKTVT